MKLDELEECLSDGESVFHVSVGYDGGYTDDSVYQEFSGVYPFEGIPVRKVRPWT